MPGIRRLIHRFLVVLVPLGLFFGLWSMSGSMFTPPAISNEKFLTHQCASSNAEMA